jgi:excisionase family DNA binding protein
MAVRRQQSNPKPLLSVEETAILLGETRSTLYRAVKAGTLPLPVLRIGSRIRIPRVAVERLVAGIDPDPAPIRAQVSADQGLAAVAPSPIFENSSAPALPRSRPMCSAARRSSSGTASV